MDAFGAAASAVALVQLCVNAIIFLHGVKKTAGIVIDELDTLLHEIESLQNVSKLVSELAPTFNDLNAQIPHHQSKLLRDLDSGAHAVITECQSYIPQVEVMIGEVRGPVLPGITSRIEAVRTVFRNSKRKDEIERLRRNIRSGQIRLQTYYLSVNMIQVAANTASVQGVSDEVRRLGFRLKRQLSLTQELDRIAMDEPLSPVSRLLRSVKLNKYFDVPRSVSNFFCGRGSELAELRTAFDETPGCPVSAPKVFVIHGFPGSGKTDFSYKFAEEYRESFWGVFVIQADSHELMVNSFEKIAQYTGKQMEPNMAAAKHWLANQELPWLLILDNADDPDLDITSYFPASSLGCILITTRVRDFKLHGNVGSRSFDFERLKPYEARTVLRRAANEPKHHDREIEERVDLAALQISEELQCLPLALVSAGKTIRRKLCTWKSYLAWYRKSCDLISHRLRSGDVLREVEAAKLTVIPTIEPHLGQLEQSGDQTSSDALELIYTLGYFYHRNISFKLLKLVAKNANKAFIGPQSEEGGTSSSAGSHDPPKTVKARLIEGVVRMTTGPPALPEVLRNTSSESLDERRLRAALDKLERLNLIRCDDNKEDVVANNWVHGEDGEDSGSDFGENEYSYSLHPLVHSWVRQRHSSLWRKAVWCEAANVALAQCVVLEAKAFTGGASSHFDPRELYPHIDHARKCKREIEAQFTSNTLNMGWVRRSLVSLHLSSLGPSWLTDIGEAGRMVKYSLVYRLCGDFQTAADLQNKVRSFVVSRRTMNDTVSIYITLALASTMQHLTEFGKAAALQNEVVQACRKVYGADHPQTLTMIDQYGLLLLYHGRLHECTNAHQEAFDGFSRLGDQSRRQALIAKAHLGAVRSRYMDFSTSRTLCEEAVDGLEELDPNDDEVLWAKESLALACGELNDGTKAYELMRHISNKRAATLGQQHPFTLWAAVGESRALWKLKRYDDALDLLKEPRKIAKITLGTKHFGYLAAETLRACVLKDQGRYEKAQKVLSAVDVAYDEIKAERGTDHADRIIALGYQFDLYDVQDMHEEALRTGERMLESLRTINKEGLGWKHPLRQRVEDKMETLRQRSGLGGDPPLSDASDGLRQRQVTSTQAAVSPGGGLMRFHAADGEIEAEVNDG